MANHRETPGVAPVPAGTPTENLAGKSFIGGKSKQFQGATRSVPEEVRMAPAPDVPVKVEDVPEEDQERCSACDGLVEDAHLFCPTCGLDLTRKDVASALSIKLTDDDIGEYLFKGYLVKEVPLIKGKMATFKTLTPAEANAAEEAVTKLFKDRDATNAQLANVYAQVYLSYGWVKFDGASLGDTPESRKEFIDNKVGVHLVDMASKKWNLFNRAISAMLEDPDVLKN